MKQLNTLLHGALMMGAAAVGSLAAAPLGTAFNYQGRLEQDGLPAPNGIYQMTFALFADALSGNLIASNNVPSVPVTNGLFNTTLDFGLGYITTVLNVTATRGSISTHQAFELWAVAPVHFVAVGPR